MNTNNREKNLKLANEIIAVLNKANNYGDTMQILTNVIGNVIVCGNMGTINDPEQSAEGCATDLHILMQHIPNVMDIARNRFLAETTKH